jgi:hypothetical protein
MKSREENQEVKKRTIQKLCALGDLALKFFSYLQLVQQLLMNPAEASI